LKLKFENDFNEDPAKRNTTYDQDEARKAINKLLITNTQKAVLWQLVRKDWKPYNNLFDKVVGAAVYNRQYSSDDELPGLSLPELPDLAG
ncbi:MAG: hypothetical protein LBL15_05360, partial [Oscillospiraceae bacterium]|nr:hypothetical protein [Oscillospiraceae bacterium]